MKITSRGIYIEEIGADGVDSITYTEEQGVTVELSDVAYTWSKEEVANLIEALQAAIGESRPASNEGPWEMPEQIPERLTEVYDRDNELMTRDGGTWPERLWYLTQYGPWRAKL